MACQRPGSKTAGAARARPDDQCGLARAAAVPEQAGEGAGEEFNPSPFNYPSHRYISRMQQAVRVLYGSASPSEAFQSTRLDIAAVDLAEFAKNVAANAGIADLRYTGDSEPLFVRADEFPLEDVFAHVLKNADRHRRPDTSIVIELASSDSTATVAIRNSGPQIPEQLLARIFEYGVSEQPEAGNRGQGLFLARTYMAKMGGTITARNAEGGVSFELGLQRVWD